MGVATTAAPYGFWATNPTKKLAHWVYLLGQPLSRIRVFQNFSGEPPLKKSRFRALFVILNFLGIKKGLAPHRSGASKPDQKVAPISEFHHR